MCFVCERNRKIKCGVNPYFVKSISTGYVVFALKPNEGVYNTTKVLGGIVWAH